MTTALCSWGAVTAPVANALDLALESDTTLPRPVSLHLGPRTNRAQLSEAGGRFQAMARWAVFAGTDVRIRLAGGLGLETEIYFDDEHSLIIETVLSSAELVDLGQRLRMHLDDPANACSITVPASRFAAVVLDEDEFAEGGRQ